MFNILKWVGILFAGLIALVLVLAGTLYALSTSRLNKSYAVQPAAVTIPDQTAALERGAYIYATSCMGCHSEDLSGKLILDDPVIGLLPAPNLTGGQGGVGEAYSDQDFVRAIRHGVAVDGTPLMIMPSQAFWHYSDEDLGALIAYINAAAPVDNELGEKVTRPLGRILMAVGAFGDVFAAEVLDHETPRPAAPAQSVSAEYGQYLVNTRDCRACHGASLAGGQSSEPGAPAAPDLTRGGVLSIWSQSDFITTLRSGVTPYGKALDASFMPWKEYGLMTDEDLAAMFLYLETLPAE